MTKTKYTVPFITDYSDVPLVKMKHGGTEFFAIIDTGSESTFVDKKFVQSNDINVTTSESNMSYVGFGGEVKSEELTSMVEFNCSIVGKFRDYPICVNATLTDLSPIQSYFDKWSGGVVNVPMLIGSDTLMKVDATIGFDKKQFTFYTDDNEDRQKIVGAGEAEQ